jgi:hypothetical protein
MALLLTARTESKRIRRGGGGSEEVGEEVDMMPCSASARHLTTGREKRRQTGQEGGRRVEEEVKLLQSGRQG